MIKTIFATLLIVGSLTLNFNAFSQNNIDFDGRLKAKFSKSELKTMSSDQLNYWTFFLDNAYEIKDLPKEKPDAVPDVVQLKSMEKADINILKLGLVPNKVARNYFRIDGTSKMIVLYGQSEIDENFKSQAK